MRVLIAAFLAGFLALPAQQTAPAPAAPKVKFETNVQLVVVNVSAKDRSGNPLEALKASDFTVTEDGKQQKLSVFEYQRLEETAAPAPALRPRPAAAPAAPAQPKPTAVASAVKNTIAPSKPGEIKYRDRRLLVLFFDLAGMPIPDQFRAQAAARKFVTSQMTASDLAAIMTYSNDLNVVQDFTDDRDVLMTGLKGLVIGEGADMANTVADDSSEDTGAAFTQDDTEFNIFNTDRQLAALESAVKLLGSLAEKKALVYFASGMSRTGIDNQAQMRATINAAIRSNVAFYPIDARGLAATAPLGDATKAAPGGQGMYSGSSARSNSSNFQAQQETLYTLAADTGGKALLDNNDLAFGIVQAQKDISSYYILGYYSTNGNLDGHYRRIKVQVAGNLSAKLDYRSGYFASKDFRKFDSSDRERQLQEAMALGDPITDLSVAIEIGWFRMARDRYFVPVAVKIPGNEIELARHGGAESTRLDFIGQVRDQKGAIAGNVRDFITVKLKGETAGQLAKRNLTYDTGFTLAPGKYTLKFMTRENESGKMGTFETPFVVPDLTAEQRYLPISSVVLSYQREDLAAAVASAESNRRLLASNPLVQGNRKLIPSVTRVFRREQEMFVYLETYQPGAQTTRPVVASVSFFRGKVKAFETEPLQVSDGLNQAKAVPLRFSLSLGKLEPGRYTCQVSVLDPEARKFAFWRAPVVLLP